MEDLARMRLGFLGTGSITSAIVTGLRADRGLPCPILLSPRNAHVAARLATWEEAGIFDACARALDAILARIRSSASPGDASVAE